MFDITANLVIDVAGTLVTILAEDVTAATDAKAIACTDIKQNFVMYEVMHGVSPYGEFDWTNTDGCSKTDYSDRTCVGTGLLEQTTYKLRVREKCGLPIASGPFIIQIQTFTADKRRVKTRRVYIQRQKNVSANDSSPVHPSLRRYCSNLYNSIQRRQYQSCTLLETRKRTS